jgi:para-nitrobenzyl esterase
LDVPFVFDNAVIVPEKVGTSHEARDLAALMSESWMTFARRGDPNVHGLPAWPTYDVSRRATMVFDSPPKVVNDPRGNERRMFAQVPYVQPGT